MQPETILIERDPRQRLYADGDHVISQSLLADDLVQLSVAGATYYITARDYWRVVAGESVEARLRKAPGQTSGEAPKEASDDV